MRLVLGIAGVAAFFQVVAIAGDRPPEGVAPLSKVLETVQGQGLSPIVEASFDDGVWEIEGFRSGRPVEAHVDPKSLAIVMERSDSPKERPSKDSLTAAKIVQMLEQKQYGPVEEIDWDHGTWEVEAVRNCVERELRIAPATGQVTSDSADD